MNNERTDRKCRRNGTSTSRTRNDGNAWMTETLTLPLGLDTAIERQTLT